MTAIQRLCLGTAQFGMKYGVANKQGQPSFEKILEILSLALKEGVEYLDTAQGYGNAEELIGQALTDLKATNKVKLVTKLHPDFSYHSFNDLEQALNISLERLQRESVWGILLHRTKLQGDWDLFFEGVTRLKKEKKISYFGVSVYTLEEALSFLEKSAVDLIQIPFNIFMPQFLPFFKLAERKGKQLFVRSVYLQGLLLLSEPELKKTKMEWALPYLKHLHNFLKKEDLNLKSFALQMVLQESLHSKVLVGVEDTAQLQENIKFFSQSPLPPSLTSKWWKNLPEIPPKMQNPSLW